MSNAQRNILTILLLLSCLLPVYCSRCSFYDFYFYHGDHLGSANWITDIQGLPIQYIHYAPYGELIANQHITSYDERYKFTGKERDAESGYDAFGARYLSSVFGHWLSADPLVDKYLWISPYAYAAWNPIKYKDPNGKWVQAAVGALVSGSADAAIQVGSNMLEGQSFSTAVRNINGKQVLGSAIAGAIGVGVVSKVSQAAKIYKLGKTGTALAKTLASPVGDAAGSVANQVIADDDHNVSSEQIKDDIVAGAIGSAVGGVVSSYVKKSSGYKSALKKLNRAERMAENSQRASRTQALQEAENTVENYGAEKSQAYSSGATEAVKATRNATDNNQ